MRSSAENPSSLVRRLLLIALLLPTGRKTSAAWTTLLAAGRSRRGTKSAHLVAHAPGRSDKNDEPSDRAPSDPKRRNMLLVASGGAVVWHCWSRTASAAAEAYKVQKKDIAYQFQPPPSGFEQTQKPVKTHLEEVNFKSSTVSGYLYGITVDPVRIDSLPEFGTPAEVAAKVVLAEINRDGVFDVTLTEDPVEGKSDNSVFYQLNYVSSGKRGRKRFVTKFYIRNKLLYALTAQCKEEDYAAAADELLAAAASFKLL